jgi:HD-like signal output (HDOD) protein
MDSDRSSARNVADVLARDPALSAKILRLANSAYFGLSRPVADVATACVVLGFDLVRNLAIGVTTLDVLTRKVEGVLDGRAAWRHAVAAAVAARAVAVRVGAASPGTAFCAGILHDVGKLVLATVDGARYGAVVRAGRAAARAAASAADPPPTLRERETEAFGADHAEIGGWLADAWRFPHEIREAITLHHEPWRTDPTSRWGALAGIADTLAIAAGHAGPPGAESEPRDPDPRSLTALGLDPGAWAELAGVLPDELARLDPEAGGAARMAGPAGGEIRS